MYSIIGLNTINGINEYQGAMMFIIMFVYNKFDHCCSLGIDTTCTNVW